MLFNSFEFLVFFPLVTGLFYVTPHRFRWLLLLLASAVFYCYFIPAYLLILGFTIVIDYCAGILIEQSSQKKQWLICSIVANLGMLCLFKYYNFFVGEVQALTGIQLAMLQWALPIGLSFHTFQAMSYTIEVYRGQYKAERHFGLYALYVLFYPQLVAGPIERPQNILPQFKKPVTFQPDNLLEGLRLMLWGLFKKLVIADRAAIYVNIVYAHPAAFHWLNVLSAILLFTIQIYCDFSGYSDIARGAAKCMGYDLMINFNRPFFANGIRDFWRRWHISLSTWFRDYVYIPLGGSKQGTARTILALLIVFMLSGIWHGAGWNFAIWGLLHAVLVIFTTLVIRDRPINKILSTGVTFIVVAYAFIFFRVTSPGQAWSIIRASVHWNTSQIFTTGISAGDGTPGIGQSGMLLLLAYIAGMLMVEYHTSASMTEMKRYSIFDTALLVFIVLSILLFGVFTKETFIYFQF